MDISLKRPAKDFLLRTGTRPFGVSASASFQGFRAFKATCQVPVADVGRWARSLFRGIVVVILSMVACIGCATTAVTPGQIAVAPVGVVERVESLKRWSDAIGLCNEFLSSPFRKTLPQGRLQFADDNMEFRAGGEVLPVIVRCTTWGDLVVLSKTGTAQERSDGFVVGLVKPKRNRLVDNSFFKTADGQPYSGAAMAQVILHELTHSYYRTGTVGWSEGFLYYLEAVCLLRNRTHTAERLPYQTSAEFLRFIQARNTAGVILNRREQREPRERYLCVHNP